MPAPHGPFPVGGPHNADFVEWDFDVPQAVKRCVAAKSDANVHEFALVPNSGNLLSRQRKSESGWKLLIPKRKKLKEK